MPRAQVKDGQQYRALRRLGESREKSARIANASAATSGGRPAAGAVPARRTRNGRSGSCLDRARVVGIAGRSSMSKTELIKALRDH